MTTKGKEKGNECIYFDTMYQFMFRKSGINELVYLN